MRNAAFATKAEKDGLQAMQMLGALMKSAPDELGVAKVNLVSRGKGWRDKLEKSLSKARTQWPETVQFLDELA